MGSHPVVGLVSSRKAWIAVLSVIGASILVGLGKIPYDHFLDFLKWVIAAWFAAFAAEDIGKAVLPSKSSGDKNDPTT